MLALLLMLAFPVLEEGRDYEKWLQERVPYIISGREKDEFNSLQSDEERERFIELFWKRRDPDPSTVVNEFRQEHLRRIEYANRRFDREGKPGWKTARGRAYIIHGPPDNVSYYYGSQQKVIVRNPTDILNQTGTAQPIIDVEFPTPASETWIYRYLPSATSYRSNFTIIFAKMDATDLYSMQKIIASVGNDDDLERRRQRDLAIKRFITNRDYLRNDYRVVYAGEPMVADLSDLLINVFDPFRSQLIDQFEIIRAQADLNLSSGEVLEERAERRRKMEALVEGRVFVSLLPVQVGYAFLRSLGGHVNIPLHVQIGLEGDPRPREVDLFAELINPEGQAAAQFQDRIRSLDKDDALSRQVSYQSRLAAPPGPYRFRVVVSDIENKRIGIWEKDIEVPRLKVEGFEASELVLVEEVIHRDEFQRRARTRSRRDWILYGQQNPLRLDEWIFVPSVDQRFRRRQNLTTLVEVYNPSLDDGKQPQVSLQAVCLKQGNQPVAATEVKELTYLTGDNRDIIVYALSFPLRTLDPGEYDLMVHITDQPTGRSLRRSVPFRIY
ncbi:MAG TPA: GWxTD domain-containing protein [Acidobacteriota bacterium]|nr:GWxTD domain-containing protein [Acidobacteriota bacterium]